MAEQEPLIRVGPRGPEASPQIPFYQAEAVDIDDERWAEVTCGRCLRMFMVNPEQWLQSAVEYTRPCPYCFKVGRLPSKKRRR